MEARRSFKKIETFDGEKLIFTFTSVLLVKISCSTKARIRKQLSKDVIVQKKPENHNGAV